MYSALFGPSHPKVLSARLTAATIDWERIGLDHAIADELSGAFRLAKNATGGIQLSLQANQAGVATPALRAQLMDHCTRHGFAELEVELFEPEDFPWRPLLDYERKFAYVAAATD
mgnify:CR=1 FL=1